MIMKISLLYNNWKRLVFLRTMPGIKPWAKLMQFSLHRPLRQRFLLKNSRALQLNSQKLLTILIPHRNRFDSRIRNLFQSLKNQSSSPHLSVMVVDFGSRSDVLWHIKELVNELQYQFVSVPEKSYWNKAEALNAGLENVSTPLVFISDVDMIYSPTFFEEVIQILTVEPLSYVVSACLDLPSGYSQDIDVIEFDHLQSLANPRFGKRFHYGQFGAYAECLRSIGGFDEGFLLWGGEDANMYRRLMALGLEPCVVEGSCYLHQWHPKYEGVDPSMVLEQKPKNLAYFNSRKHIVI